MAPVLDTSSDAFFMKMAMEEAAAAIESGDIPVGAVLVKDGVVIGKGRNERELLKSPVAHAEVQAIAKGAETIGHWNLTGTKLYVTLEPCVMCCGALVLARVEEVVYAASDAKGGAISLSIPILQHEKLNHRVAFRQGPFAEECSKMLSDFFRELRKKKTTS